MPGGRTPPGGPFAALCAAGPQKKPSRKPPAPATTGCTGGRSKKEKAFKKAHRFSTARSLFCQPRSGFSPKRPPSRAQRGERTARGRPAPGHYRLPPSAHPCALGGGKRAHPCARRGGHRPHLGLVLAVWAGALFAQAQHTGPNQCAIQSRYVDILWITCG